MPEIKNTTRAAAVIRVFGQVFEIPPGATRPVPDTVWMTFKRGRAACAQIADGELVDVTPKPVAADIQIGRAHV